MQDPTSDITFRPQSPPVPRRDDAAWEAVIREELLKLRRRTPSTPRVVPASRPEPATDPAATSPPAR
jgi:hypothetical protein